MTQQDNQRSAFEAWLNNDYHVDKISAEEREIASAAFQAAIELDRQGRGEPVAWIHEDELPNGYPYDDMYPFSKVDGVRMFPVFWPDTVLTLGYLEGHKDGLEWAAQLAEANHPLTSDWLYDDPHDLAKAIRKGPEMPPVAPHPAAPTTKESLTVAEPVEVVSQAQAYCEPCQKVGMRNCSDFVNCGNARCLTCKQLLTAEPVKEAIDAEISQFLADVMTAAGLVTHGKQCKELGKRLAEGSERLRAAVYRYGNAAQPIEDRSLGIATLKDVDAMIRMLRAGEWAEHVGSTPMGRSLEAAITKLHAQPAARYDPHAENAEFHAWWDANQACPEHSLTTENAAHATWQERAKRAAQPSVPDHLIKRLLKHAENKENTAFARSAMREVVQYLATPPADVLAQQDDRYAELEREHLGCPDRKTGIYAPKEEKSDPAMAGDELSDADIDAIFYGMPNGVNGWLKDWGYRQFARALLKRVQPASREDAELRRFLDVAAGEGYVFDGVDAGDLYLRLFPAAFDAAAQEKP